MAYLNAHHLLVMGGPLVAGSEEWTMSLRLGSGNSQPSLAEDQAVGQDMAAAIRSWFQGQFVIGSRAQLAYVKYNRVDPLGKYVHQTTVRNDLSTPVNGTAQSPYPPQVSLVATLKTAVNRGLASQGRIFLPAPSLPFETSTGQISGPNTQAAADAVAGLIAAINGVVATAGGPRVFVMSKVRDGAANRVTHVTVGSVYDTMRSRRAALEEVRSRATVAGSG